MATCFHHPDRETGRACTRCGRPACPDCLIQASVGSQCFECVRAGAPARSTRIRQVLRGEQLVATKLLIAITAGVFVLTALRDQNIDGTGRAASDLALFGPFVHRGDWWRLLTYSLVHYGLIHIFFNLFVLQIVGRVLEPGTGAPRFLTLYTVSVLAGAAGALITSPHQPTGGASGGVFGLAAAATLVMHRRGIRFWDTGFGPLLVINLALGLFVSNISLGGHIGGLVGGALTAEAMVQARKAEMPALGYVAAAVVGFASIGVAYVAAGR